MNDCLTGKLINCMRVLRSMMFNRGSDVDCACRAMRSTWRNDTKGRSAEVACEREREVIVEEARCGEESAAVCHCCEGEGVGRWVKDDFSNVFDLGEREASLSLFGMRVNMR